MTIQPELVVNRITFLRPAERKRHWYARCHCGNEWVVFASNVVAGYVNGCGCARRTDERRTAVSAQKSTHRHAVHENRSPTYRSWLSMKTRCLNPNATNYPEYGGNGISVCERWLSFENFLADMGERPSVAHSLDRFPDQRGNYELGNCRWATWSEQADNRHGSFLAKLPPEAVSDIVSRYQNGESMRTIGDAHGLSRFNVAAILKRR